QACPDYAHKTIQTLSSKPIQYINSTSRFHSPSDVETRHFINFDQTQTKQEAIAKSLVSPQTSTLRIRPQRGSSIIQASPSEYINSTSHSASPSDVKARHFVNSNQTLPPSKKQSQYILYRHRQARREFTHNEVQALSKQAHPSTSTRHPALTPHPMYRPIVLAKHLPRARSNFQSSRITTD
uniref:Uncharacterized protein n=1 Tax=Cucumis melo TaxID=3656 RepID=A0A9I9DIY8_CUCME